MFRTIFCLNLVKSQEFRAFGSFKDLNDFNPTKKLDYSLKANAAASYNLFLKFSEEELKPVYMDRE